MTEPGIPTSGSATAATPGARGRFALGDRDAWPLVMGILNVTPDSFSDGGTHFDPAVAVSAALEMEAAGASIVDIGGESTRPGSDPVAVDEELGRVLPVIAGIRGRSGIGISIDTRRAAVARAAIAAGAEMVNDVSALRDPNMAAVVREAGVPIILMHMRGEPKTMQEAIGFQAVVSEVYDELAERRDAARAAGIDRAKILVDPGIGFGKTFDHNLELLAHLGAFTGLAPVVVGASRKAFIGHLTGRPAGPERAAGSLAAVAAAASAGAAMVRVHDVPQTVDFLRVFAPIARRRR